MGGGYAEVTVTADPSTTERLVGILSQLGFEGFWEDGPVLRCYMSADRWSPPLLEEVRSVAAMVARAGSAPAPAVSFAPLADQNWNAEWERTIRPIRVTDRIVVRPSWHEYAQGPGDIVLTIDPKMSFGTGYHESTRLVLRLLERSVRQGMAVLDVGTGTGIVAIAAVRLGAASATAVDIDEWSSLNARENAALNGVAASVRVIQGDIGAAPAGPFDLVAANIQRTVIEPMLPDLKRRLAPEAPLLLAGLLDADREPMTTALAAAGLRPEEEILEGEWIALAVRAQPRSRA